VLKNWTNNSKNLQNTAKAIFSFHQDWTVLTATLYAGWHAFLGSWVLTSLLCTCTAPVRLWTLCETSYPLNSLCQKWKYGYKNGMFSWCSSNNVTFKHEGHFPLILTLLLGVKRNCILSGAPDLQSRKHSVIISLYKHSLNFSGCLLNWNKFLDLFYSCCDH